MEKLKKWKLAGNIGLIVIFLALIVLATVKLGPYIGQLAHEPGKLKEWLDSFGWKSIPVFIALQMLQVVVAAIPGEFVQIAGGYVYGTFLGTLYSLIGIVTGSVLVFFVSRLLGYSLVRMFVSEKNLEKFEFMMNSSKSEMVMFMLFLIPGMPKDILTYIAGLTPVKPLRFFLIITIARFPALLASSYIGSNLQQQNYLAVIILSAAALVLFVAGILLKDKVIGKVQRMIHKAEKAE